MGRRTTGSKPVVELQSQDNARDLSHAEWLALLLDREAAKRDTSRFQSRLRSAKLRHGQASIEDVDYRAARRLDKASAIANMIGSLDDSREATVAVRQLQLDEQSWHACIVDGVR